MSIKINGTNSGSVTLDAPASGSDISLTLPGGTGTNGQLLSTNGSGVLSFVNGGKILQVVRASDTSSRTTTSTSTVDVTGVSVTITPQKSNSVLLILWTFFAEIVCTSAGHRAIYRITDSSNNTLSGAQEQYFGDPTNISHLQLSQMLLGYSAPATTSAVTYKARFSTTNASSTASVRGDLVTTQIYAIEVAA